MTPEERVTPADTEDLLIGKYISRFLYVSYAVMLLFSLLILLAGTLVGRPLEVFVSLPVIAVLLNALFVERRTIHIPPMLVFVMIILMAVMIVAELFTDSVLSRGIINCLFGTVLGLAGLILTYSFIPVVPEISRERTIRIVFVSMSVALSMFILMQMAQYYLSPALDIPCQTIDAMMERLIIVIPGALLISALFYIGRRSLAVRNVVVRYLSVSDAVMEVDDYERAEIAKALQSGESERVEYKSTLRTNLSTGEKDEEMEKAVLKTMVAFLNSRGGTLLIGIADDGSVIGIDEESFENRDKLNLHLTNLIASRIGNEFLPFISFRLSDYEGKGVMRIVCKKSDSPVFLKEGRQETFVVRSGPSSVELHGMDTLNYVNNRFKKRRNEKLFEKE